jgi:hypothetical protein
LNQREALAGHNQWEMMKVAKAKKVVRYTKGDIKDLKAHSKARTPIVKISKQMKRSVGALRAKAHSLGIGLGHQRWVGADLHRHHPSSILLLISAAGLLAVLSHDILTLQASTISIGRGRHWGFWARSARRPYRRNDLDGVA